MRLLLLYLIVASTLLSTSTLSADEEEPDAAQAPEVAIEAYPALPERSVETAQALSRQLPLSEQQQLSAGDESFLSLWQPANQAKAKGLVIIVPGAQESADWPLTVAPARLQLPDSGWSTLSLTLPDSLEPPLPVAILPRPVEPEPTETGEPNENAAAGDDEPEENASTEPEAVEPEQEDEPLAQEPAADTTEEPLPVIDPSERIFARFDAALAFANEQGASNIIVLGHHEGAYWAARYLNEKKPAQIQQLISIAARAPAGEPAQLAQLIPALKLATVDLYFQGQREAATQRLNASKRLEHPSYTLVPLQASPGDRQAEQTQLVRRVRGWLERKAH